MSFLAIGQNCDNTVLLLHNSVLVYAPKGKSLYISTTSIAGDTINGTEVANWFSSTENNEHTQ